MSRMDMTVPSHKAASTKGISFSATVRHRAALGLILIGVMRVWEGFIPLFSFPF